jgi:hypothetical protein
MDTGGLNNYMAAVSPDGRWVAAATFTSDVKVGEAPLPCLLGSPSQRCTRREAVPWHRPCKLSGYAVL